MPAKKEDRHDNGMMDNHDSFPYRFDNRACDTCRGNCCRGLAGYVWISVEELEAMAAAMGIDAPSFAGQYVRRAHGRLSLQERVINGEHFCCLFDQIDRRCTIYQSRPEQCRTFPFWKAFIRDTGKLLDECPGVSLK